MELRRSNLSDMFTVIQDRKQGVIELLDHGYRIVGAIQIRKKPTKFYIGEFGIRDRYVLVHDGISVYFTYYKIL